MAAHQTRRAPALTSLECPLASLGRNTSAAMDRALNMSGHHQPPPYHHPLSSSPLNPQVYQMSRKSPDLSIDADDIIYTSSVSQQGDTIDGIVVDDLDDIEEDDAAAANTQSTLPEIYHLSRSSSRSSLDLVPVPVQRKAATFELRGRHGFAGGSIMTTGMCTSSSTSSVVGRNQNRSGTLPQRTYFPIESLLQYGRPDRTPSAYHLHGNNNNIGSNNNNSSANNSKSNNNNAGDTEESSDSTSGHINRHQGGRCSVPTVSSSGLSNGQYFLEKKMDALYFSGGGIRGLPLGSETNHFQNEGYFLEDGLMQDSHLIHHRPSSPSETSGSDRYLLNRTSSPVNVFSSSNNHVNSNNNNNNLAVLEQRHFHHTKVKSLSDGLCSLGRFSPSLDQGYATLVSPSPTGHHTNTLTTHSILLHPPPLPLSASTMNAVSRRHVETVTATGPPPWNKKSCRSGPVFDRLPDEALLKLFSWLDSCELCNVARVCRRFENLAWRPVLWKVITLRGEHLNGDKTLKMIFRQLCGQSRNGSCPDVERVMLSDGCRISDKGLTLLTRRCPELTHLQLQTCVNITNQALTEVLTRCTNLQHLDVTACTQVNNISVHPGLEPPRRLLLQYLDLTDCLAIDDVGLKTVVKNCPQLVYLYLRRCIQITDAGLKFVPSFCIALKELSVSDCLNITDFGLYELAKLGAALRYLSVAKCDRVSDAGLKVIARRCYKLRYLNARGCEAVSDDSITVLARSCPRLRALDIGKCDVSDAGLRALAESCPNLKKLSLRNCDMITDRGVQCIAYYCRGLQQLNIQDCQISVEGYRAVKKYCKRCIIEHTNPGFC